MGLCTLAVDFENTGRMLGRPPMRRLIVPAGSEKLMNETHWFSDQDAFDRVCGDCAGVDVSGLTDDDVRTLAAYWNDCPEDMVEAALRALHQFQQSTAEKAR
jgi:hypothetical protein